MFTCWGFGLEQRVLGLSVYGLVQGLYAASKNLGLKQSHEGGETG